MSDYSKESSAVLHNSIAHNKIFKIYNVKHTEIFNEYEQTRVKNIVFKLAQNASNILDLGAGTGNLTLKFLELRCKVTAADVSYNSLVSINKIACNDSNLKIAVLKDNKLPFEDNAYDVIATYSVLHHIDNYLNTVQEMIRVVKPGGLIYIDHEANLNRYKPDQTLREYYSLTRQTILEHVNKLIKTKELFTYDFVKAVFIKLLINRKYQREGDIHVWSDDYINWNEIKQTFINADCEIVEEVDYLLYRPKGGLSLYQQYMGICNDTKYIIAKKKAN